MTRAITPALLLTVSALVVGGGCITLPKSTTADGRPSPAAEFPHLLAERRLELYRSGLRETVDVLETAVGLSSPRPPEFGWYANPGARRLVLTYMERRSVYGVGISSHTVLPWPGVLWDYKLEPRQVALVLSFDDKGTLIGWSREAVPDLSGYVGFDPSAGGSPFPPAYDSG